MLYVVTYKIISMFMIAVPFPSRSSPPPAKSITTEIFTLSDQTSSTNTSEPRINPESESPSSSSVSDALENGTSSSNELSPSITGGVIAGLVVIIVVIIAIVAVVIAAFVYKRGRTVKVESAKNKVLMSDAIYENQIGKHYLEICRLMETNSFIQGSCQKLVNFKTMLW